MPPNQTAPRPKTRQEILDRWHTPTPDKAAPGTMTLQDIVDQYLGRMLGDPEYIHAINRGYAEQQLANHPEADDPRVSEFRSLTAAFRGMWEKHLYAIDKLFGIGTVDPPDDPEPTPAA